MRLHIAAIGAKPGVSESALIADYCKRANAIGRNIGLSGPDINAFDSPKSLTGAKRRAREGAMLLGAAPANAKVIALDENGKNTATEELAALVERWRDDGVPAATFMIGGADGHDAPVLDRADLKLSFGALTWPHMLVRVMVTEQLYRVMTILSGHPYHRS